MRDIPRIFLPAAGSLLALAPTVALA